MLMILTRNAVAANTHQLYKKGTIVKKLYDAANPYVVVELDSNVLIFTNNDLEVYNDEPKDVKRDEESVSSL